MKKISEEQEAASGLGGLQQKSFHRCLGAAGKLQPAPVPRPPRVSLIHEVVEKGDIYRLVSSLTMLDHLWSVWPPAHEAQRSSLGRACLRAPAAPGKEPPFHVRLAAAHG